MIDDDEQFKRARWRQQFRRGLSARLEAADIEPNERAEILGHSIETNLRYYTFAKPDYLKRVKEALG